MFKKTPLKNNLQENKKTYNKLCKEKVLKDDTKKVVIQLEKNFKSVLEKSPNWRKYQILARKTCCYIILLLIIPTRNSLHRMSWKARGQQEKSGDGEKRWILKKKKKKKTKKKK